VDDSEIRIMRPLPAKLIPALGVMALLLTQASCALLQLPEDLLEGAFGTPQIEADVHRLVNDYRRGRGLEPLVMDQRISMIAREHSQAMAAGRRELGHEGFDARAAAVRQLGIAYLRFAENVGMNNYPAREAAREAVQGWIDSSGHRQNILGDFQMTGIGVAAGPDGRYYFTQLFVGTE
jgi:uncharacterized protein YkwD